MLRLWPQRPDGPFAEGDASRAIGVRMIDGGIIEVVLPPNQEIEGPEARIAGNAARSLAAGRRMPVLLVITGVVGVSLEARQVYTGSIAASAFALVGESPVDRVIAHYLLRSRSETIPAQFFTSESAADRMAKAVRPCRVRRRTPGCMPSWRALYGSPEAT